MFGWASCLVHVWCVYHVVCFFSIVPVSLRSWGFVRLRMVRLRGFIRLSSSWTHSSSLRDFRQDDRYRDLTIIFAMLVASFYRFAALPITCLSSHPKLPWTSNLWHLSYANHCLAMYRFSQPSYSVASCRWSWRFLHGGQDFGCDIIVSLILLMHLYTW